MPSEQTNIALSLKRFRGITFTVGAAITPHDFAKLSPKLRDIAKPGCLVCLLQTRIGPTFLPVTYDSNWSNTPPILFILSDSSGYSGL